MKIIIIKRGKIYDRHEQLARVPPNITHHSSNWMFKIGIMVENMKWISSSAQCPIVPSETPASCSLLREHTNGHPSAHQLIVPTSVQLLPFRRKFRCEINWILLSATATILLFAESKSKTGTNRFFSCIFFHLSFTVTIVLLPNWDNENELRSYSNRIVWACAARSYS